MPVCVERFDGPGDLLGIRHHALFGRRQIPHVRSGDRSSIDRWCQCCLVPGCVRRLGARLPLTCPNRIASKKHPRENRNLYRVMHSTECNENVRLVQSVQSKIVVKFL